MGLLQVRQIYYKPEQEASLIYPGFYNPVPEVRDERYIFLESDCWAKAIRAGEYEGFDFFGLVAPNFQEKIKASRQFGSSISNRSRTGFRKDRLEDFARRHNAADVIALTKHTPHAVFPFAEKFHPGINKITQKILGKIGFVINIKDINQKPVYFNYFVAKGEVLERFYVELLFPAMHVMIHDRSIRDELWKNSNYPKAFPEHLQKLYGVEHWPFHPFICERLITLFISKYNLKVEML